MDSSKKMFMCPCCGKPFYGIEDNKSKKFCSSCQRTEYPYESKYNRKHYEDIARIRYPVDVSIKKMLRSFELLNKYSPRGAHGEERFEEVIEEEPEFRNNPLFNKELYDKRVQRQIDYYKKSNMEMAKRNLYGTPKPKSKPQTKTQPKCPTCGSVNVVKISATSKVAGAALFGLFSKTARSQFKCNDCGYKW